MWDMRCLRVRSHGVNASSGPAPFDIMVLLWCMVGDDMRCKLYDMKFVGFVFKGCPLEMLS